MRDGCPVGRSQHSNTFRLKHRVEAGWEFGSAIADQAAQLLACIRPSPDQLPRLRGQPFRRGMSRTTGKMDPPTTEFDEEPGLQRLAPGRFDGKEVAGQDLGALMLEQRAPVAAVFAALRSRRDGLSLQDVAPGRPTAIKPQLE